MLDSSNPITIIYTFLIVIFSIIIHEVSHGYAAYIQGDETAYRQGRLTLNPLPHIDMFGSVIVPLLAFLSAGTFFGWAKPVPYNVHNIRTRLGQAFVAAAGVLSNLIIAALAGIAVTHIPASSVGQSLIFEQGLMTIAVVNLSLAFFNLIPIPPFDGMSILEALFPRLAFRTRIMYNPVYMIAAILLASTIFSHIFPVVIQAFFNLLM